MNVDEMEALFRSHRKAEARRDYDAVIATFAPDCYLETVALGLRSVGQRTWHERPTSGTSPRSPTSRPTTPVPRSATDVMVTWGYLRGHQWRNVARRATHRPSFVVPFTNVTVFRDDVMAGESIYFDLATLCEQARLPIDDVRQAAKAHAPRTHRQPPLNRRSRASARGANEARSVEVGVVDDDLDERPWIHFVDVQLLRRRGTGLGGASRPPRRCLPSRRRVPSRDGLRALRRSPPTPADPSRR